MPSQPYVFDFSVAIQETLRDYPREMANFAFIDKEKRAVVKYNCATLEKKSLFLEFLPRILQHVDKQPSFASQLSTEIGVSFMFYHRALPDKNPIPMPDLEMSCAAIFDHELGHHLNKNGHQVFPSTHHDAAQLFMDLRQGKKGEDTRRHEACADAFMSLRHFQRFGQNPADLTDYSALMTYGYLVTGKAEHLTTPVIEALRQDARTEDFTKLTPVETVAKANAYALKYAITDTQLAEIKNAYAPVMGQEGLDTETLAELLGQQTPQSLAFQLGAGVLSYFMKAFPDDHADPKWDHIRANLQKHASAAPSGVSSPLRASPPQMSR